MSARIPVVLGWLGLFGVFLVSMPGTYVFEDGPELLACASVLGNTHPPGYPLLSLVGRLAMVVPVGSAAFRFGFLIAACAAAAAVCWGALAARLVTLALADKRHVVSPVRATAGAVVAVPMDIGTAETTTVPSGTAVASSATAGVAAGVFAGPVASATAGVAAGVFAGGVWALSDSFWWESLIGDKYGPYYLAFAVLVWVSVEAMRAELPGLTRAAAWLGLATGLAFAHHQYAIFALPAVACAAGRAVLMRALGARLPLARAVCLGVFLGALAFSTRVLYPPLRSAGGAAVDWGRPARVSALGPYIGGALYRGGFVSTSLPENPELGAGRWRLAARFLFEEIPWPLLLAAPAGALFLARRLPLAAWAGFLCLLANMAWSINFSEKVVRWYEPAYALLLLSAAAGWVWVLVSLRGAARTAALVLLAVVPLAWQAGRGAARNDLSRFYAAHDYARTTLRSLPPGSVYLGAGDFDLFPLWALWIAERERGDVGIAGLGSFVDTRLAGSGAEDRILGRLGVRGRGVAGLAELLALKRGPAVFVAACGNDRRLQEAMPFLKSTEIHGLAGMVVRVWSPSAGAAATRRAARGMTLRNLRYARSGALGDLVRVRDEVARGALLQYPACLATLGAQCAHFGLEVDAAWAFGRARAQMEALVGPLEPPAAAPWLPALAARARRDQQAVALGYERLADVLAARGVTFLADQVRGNASALLQ